MKTAKSCKIILLVAFLLSMLISVLTFSAVPVSAGTITPTKSFIGGIGSADISYTDGNLKLTVDDEDKVYFVSKLAIDDLEFYLTWDDNVSDVVMELTYDSYYLNGNKKVDGTNTTFEKSIVLEKQISEGITKISVSDFEVSIETNNATKTFSDDYYKIRVVDKASAKISFKVRTVDNQRGVLSFSYVNQKAGEGENSLFNQKFSLENEKLVEANPIVSLADSGFFVKQESGAYEKIAFQPNEKDLGQYTLKYTAYSVLNNTKTFYPTYVSGRENDVNISTNGNADERNNIVFRTSPEAKFQVWMKDGDNGVMIEEYTVKVVKDGEKFDESGEQKFVNKAPKYVDDDNAIEAFNYALEKALTKEVNGVKTSVEIGTKIELPTLEDLIADDRTPYSKLSTSLYVLGPKDTESSSSSLSITLNDGGAYKFYVVVNDKESGVYKDDKMEKKDFIEYVNDEDIQDGIKQYGPYEKFIFDFDVVDDGTITVSAKTAQSVGYIGTKYTASKFTINGADYENYYSLWYSSDVSAQSDDDEAWTEIAAVKDVKKGESANGVSYATISKIGYDGELSFTPHKKGAYKLVCVASRVDGTKSDDASTVIRVRGATIDVSPSEFVTWIKANTASVIFLSVGVLCLAGIIVLLFIKPKDKVVDDEE